MDASSLPDVRAQPTIWIVEDEPPAAELAAELCTAGGAEPSVFRSALPFLRAFREAAPPRAIVLDWRLEHAVGRCSSWRPGIGSRSCG